MFTKPYLILKQNKNLFCFLTFLPFLLVSCKKDKFEAPAKIADVSSTKPGGSTSTTTTTSASDTSTSTKNLLFFSSFEAANSISTRANSTTVFCNIEEPFSSSITRSDSIAYSGSYSMKILLNKSDPVVNGGKRAEVSFKQDSAVQVERWIGVNMFLPKSYIVDPEPECVLQYHDIPDLADGGVWRSPPFALETINGRWLFIRRWSAARLTSNLTSSEQDYDLGPYSTSAWTKWVFHIRFAWDSTGLIEIWKDGNLVLTVNGPNAYNDKTGNYLKVGIYKWMWNPEYDTGLSTTKQRVIFVDNLKYGNANASYNQVAN